MFAYDTETTGSDLWHGCLPFFFAFTFDNFINEWYEWDVDPFTRKPIINHNDLNRITEILCSPEDVVAHNAPFDLRATETILKSANVDYCLEWQWESIEDSCVASHVLRNLWGHSLKELRSIFLLVDNTKQEALRQATNQARRIVRTDAFQEAHGVWRIADEGDPHWPAVHRAPNEENEDISGWWLLDTWLPRTIATLAPEFLPEEYKNDSNTRGTNCLPSREIRSNSQRRKFRHRGQPNNNRPDEKHTWFTVLRDYALEDSETTLPLWTILKNALKEEGLYDQYLKRKGLLQPTYEMETLGVTTNDRLNPDIKRYNNEAHRHNNLALRMATTSTSNVTSNDAHDNRRTPTNLQSNKQLAEIIYGDFNLPVIRRTKTGLPSTKAEVLKDLRHSIPEDHPAYNFISALLLSKTSQKSSDSLTSYREWMLGDTIHAGINITGTKFCRQSMSNPNLQNVGTGKETEDGSIDYNLRECLGPRKWWNWLAFDYSNIELRIWGYECGNKEFIACFENNISVHYLIACELYPDLRKMDPEEVKEDRRYKRTKNGNFAIIYGSSPAKANATYGRGDAYNIISRRFPEVRSFTEKLHSQVLKYGYIETLTGYRLYIPLSEPHKAVSGRVQGTAGAVIGQAMIDCHRALQSHPEWMTNMILQIHDELVFSTPEKSRFQNTIETAIFTAMEEQGKTIGIPLTVGGKRHKTNWSEGTTIERIVL